MTGVELLLKILAFAEPVVVPSRLFQTMQFFKMGLLELFAMPPPFVPAELPEMVQFVSVGLEALFCKPPP